MKKNNKSEKYRSVLVNLLPNIILIIFAVTCIYPVIWLFYSGFKSYDENLANAVRLPTVWHPENYLYVVKETKFFLWVWNSVRNTIITVVASIGISFVTGYFLSRYRSKLRNATYAFYMLAIFIPGQALMIPSYIVFSRSGLLDHWYTLPIVYTASSLSINIFLVESFIHGVPIDLEEAACIDGASFERRLFTIVMPMCTPILITAGIMTAFGAWNEFMSAILLINSAELKTIPVGLSTFQGEHYKDYGRIMAGTMCSLAPIMIVYFICSKHVMNGLMSGAIKG